MTLNYNLPNPFIEIVRTLILLLFVAFMLSNTACTPEKRLYNILSEHPELLRKDTVIKEVIKFIPDTAKAKNASDSASVKMKAALQSLVSQLDSCSKSDIEKIKIFVPSKTIEIVKDALINDCPDIIKKEPISYTTAEGHKISLIPNSKNGYDIHVIANCPLPVLVKKSKWYVWFLAGFMAGVTMCVLLALFK